MKKAPFSTWILSYVDVRDCKTHAVSMCYRDLKIIVDVLEEYARQLQEQMEKNPPQNFWAKSYTEEVAKRTMRISDRLADAIGLDKTYPKCKKFLEKQKSQNDIGEDALTLAISRGTRK